ncbi:MAG: hypothetical protein ABW217_05120 [Polyangiaceae bacterium]
MKRPRETALAPPRLDPALAPPRLGDDDPALKALFERAEREYRREHDEEKAFRRLSQRLRSKSEGLGPQRQRWRLAGALLAAVCLFALGTSIVRQRAAGTTTVRLTRESLPEAPARVELPPVPVQSPTPLLPPAPSAQPAARAPAATAERPRRDARSAPMAQPLEERSQTAPSTPAAPQAAAPVDCLALARAGEPRAAEQCFVAQTVGTGLGAELALYELARLRRDVLGDLRAALTALDDHRARFANGSLRQEVELFRVELLARLGRAQEALASSAELLASPRGHERAGELHLLRGNIFRQDLADPASATREYRAAEARGGTAAQQARRWLDQLGAMRATSAEPKP